MWNVSSVLYFYDVLRQYVYWNSLMHQTIFTLSTKTSLFWLIRRQSKLLRQLSISGDMRKWIYIIDEKTHKHDGYHIHLYDIISISVSISVTPTCSFFFLSFFLFGGSGTENDVLPTFKGIITHTSQCMVFSSRRPCFRQTFAPLILNQSDTKKKTIWSIDHLPLITPAHETEMYDFSAIGSTTTSLNKKSSTWEFGFANRRTDELDGIARLTTPILRVLKSPNQLTFLAIRSNKRRKSPECETHQ